MGGGTEVVVQRKNDVSFRAREQHQPHTAPQIDGGSGITGVNDAKQQ